MYKDFEKHPSENLWYVYRVYTGSIYSIYSLIYIYRVCIVYIKDTLKMS